MAPRITALPCALLRQKKTDVYKRQVQQCPVQLTQRTRDAMAEDALEHGIVCFHTVEIAQGDWVLLHSLIDVGSHLTAQERKTPRMQQAREMCIRDRYIRQSVF